MNKIKKMSSSLVCIITLISALTLQAQNTQNPQTADFIPGQILIKLKESAKAQKTSLSTQMKATTLKSYFKLDMELWELNLNTQNTPDGKQTTLALIEQYKNHPDVEFVEPNYLLEAIGGTEPNDPSFPQLWGLHNTGQNGGIADADIDAPEAYCLPISAIDVIVGIVDTGIDYGHEDLAPNMWQNLGEDANGNGKVLIQSGNTWIFDPGDENGIDDDGNGYIDDFVGWDFVYNDNDPMDLNSHGTHCAGTIGAVMNNNIGINGVAPNAKLAALKFLNDSGTGSTADAIDALNYAVTMGIPITNNSWGGGPFSAALYQAIQNAEANNHLFVAAAGNNKINNDVYPHYPSSYDNNNIISVAGTNRNDDLYDTGFYGTNYGATSVDIGAPGQQIYSCIPGHSYRNKSGTSMATPHIAGVCAFVLGANPGSSYHTIKSALMNADNNLPALSGKCVSEGKVNLHDALVAMGAPPNPCEDPPLPPTIEPPFETCDRNRDSLALVAFYNATNGDNWTISWDLNQSMHTWHRVSFNEHGCVGGLSIVGNNLIGSIPADLGNLSQLTFLQLQGNKLTGSIPPELGNLHFLKVLQLAANQLTGNIPAELGNLSNLESLWLHGNLLTGSIPAQIGNLFSLIDLFLHTNQLTGSIPAELGNLTNLKGLSFASNRLTGNIPHEFGNLINLQLLQFQGNNLTGNIPPELGNLSLLHTLLIAANQLTGNIPAELGNLTNLESLWLHGNLLTGSIPPQIGNQIYLIDLFLYNNQLTGNIPRELGNLTKLKGLSLAGNQLTGNIPSELGNLINLHILQLQGNNLTGNIPPQLGNLSLLHTLQLAANQLTGNIPAELGNLTNLESLWLQTNLLTGSIPPQIGNLISLTGMLLSSNQLTGNIPAELGDLTNLKTLTIGSNQLTGNIPPEFGNLTNLEHLQLQGNHLTGTIPSEMGNLTMLTALAVNSNNLSGCHDLNLLNLCDQLINDGISGGNNFDATWEDFCATEAGSCGPIVSQVWPGDFDSNGIAEFNDLLYWGAAYNNTGAIRPNATTNWVGQDCEDWSTEVNGINSKHQDGNGDGVVNNADVTVLTNNLGNTHSFTAPIGLSSSMQFNLSPDFAANITNSNNTFVYDFFVEDEGNTVTAHGISASVFFGGLNVVNASIDISNSSLNPQKYIERFDAETNTLHFSITKTNGSNSTLNGAVCKMVVQILEIDTGESFALNINSGGVMQADGTMHEVARTTVYDVYHENGILGANVLALNASAAHASCENGGSALVNAFGGNGNYCYDWNTGETTQQITDLSPGIYSVLVCDDNGVSNSIEVEVQGQFIPVYDENGDIIPCNTFATCPTIIDFEGYVPNGSHQAKSAIHTKADLENGYNVELKASNLIRLTSGFSTRGSQSFKVRMEDCE